MTVVPRKTTPTVRLRRLASELRRLRADAELTRDAVSKATGIDMGTLYRLETAKTRPQARTLKALLDLYRVDADYQEHLATLSKESTQLGWLQPFHIDLREEYTTYISFESEAVGVRNYESLFVPGLLQTESYARAIIRGVLPQAGVNEVNDRVQARLDRQRLLTKDNPLQLWAVVDEAALRRVVGGPAVMKEQLNHLSGLIDSTVVTFQVITYGAGAHPGMSGSLVQMDFGAPEDTDLIYIDSMAGELFLESPAEVRRYGQIFNDLRAIAASPSDSAKLVAAMAAEIE